MPPLPLEDLNNVFARTRDLWEEARGKSFFITGGTGFFGVWLLESILHINQALALNASVTILTRRPDSFLEAHAHLKGRKDLHFLRGDVRDFKFPDREFSHVVHAATEASVKLNAEDPLLILDTCIQGTRHTLDFAVARGCQKFLLTSSGAVYGPQPEGVTYVSETYRGGPDPLNPASAYGEGKRVSELLCAIYARQHGIECKIARCFAFVGPGLPLDGHFAAGNFIRDVINGDPVRIGGDGTSYRSYLYAADLTVWLWTILFRAPCGQPVNVGSSQELSIHELAEKVNATLGGAGVGKPEKTSGGEPSHYYVPATDIARNQLGLREWTSLSEGVRSTGDWWRSFRN